MVSRRAFLRGGSLAGLASLVPAARATVRPPAGSTGRPFEAVCDTRHAQGDAFLAAVSARAFRCHGVGTDPGTVLGVAADACPAGRVMMGLTTPATLMIAWQVVAPQGYGLVFHGEHSEQADGRLRHRLHGDEAWVAELGELLQHSADAWPRALGHALTGVPADRECTRVRNVDCTVRERTGRPGHLASWVLAPVRA